MADIRAAVIDEKIAYRKARAAKPGDTIVDGDGNPIGSGGGSGSTGATGPAGPTGPTGPTGSTGPTGPTGTGIPVGPTGAVQYNGGGDVFGATGAFTYESDRLNVPDARVSNLNTGNNVVTTDTDGDLQESGVTVETAPAGGSGFTVVEYASTPSNPPSGFLWIEAVDATTKSLNYYNGSDTFSVELSS